MEGMTPPMPPLAGTPQPPMAPTFGPPSAESPKGSRRGLIILASLGLLLVAVGAVAALGYFGGWLPFKRQAKLSDTEILARALTVLPEVKSGSVRFDASFKSEPRDADAKPLAVEAPGVQERRQAVARDEERIDEIQRISQQLRSAYDQGARLTLPQPVKPQYPASLEEVIIDANARTDPSGAPYAYASDGQTFRLTFRLESSAAVASWNLNVGGWHPLDPDVTPPPQATVGQDITLTQGQVVPIFGVARNTIDPLGVLSLKSGEFYQWLPSDLDASFNAWSDFQVPTTDGQASNAATGIGAKVAMGALQFAGSGEMRKVGDTLYGRVNEFPALGFFDLHAIKDKWVAMTEEDRIGNDLAFGFAASRDELTAKNASGFKQYQLAMDVAREQGVVGIEQVLPMVEKNGLRHHHYRIKFDPTKFAAYYRALADRSQAEFGQDALVHFNQAVADYLQGADFAQAYDEWAKNTTVEVWVQADTYLPRQFSSSLRLVPPDEVTKFAGKQFKFHLSLTLDKVNQPVQVEVPSPTISLDEATGLVTGQSPADIILQRQIHSVAAIRSALTQYQQRAGHYPETLAELKRKPSEVPVGSAGMEGIDSWRPPEVDLNQPFLKVIPHDVYTKQPYKYLVEAEGYALKYMVQLPPADPGTRRNPWFGADQYAAGENTADATTMSLEQAATEDRDSDGLSDHDERAVYGTDPFNQDTDQDGYGDGVEVRGGYDPNGPGRLPTTLQP